MSSTDNSLPGALSEGLISIKAAHQSPDYCGKNILTGGNSGVGMRTCDNRATGESLTLVDLAELWGWDSPT